MEGFPAPFIRTLAPDVQHARTTINPEQILLDLGWKYSGNTLFTHPDDIKLTSRTLKQALTMELDKSAALTSKIGNALLVS